MANNNEPHKLEQVTKGNVSVKKKTTGERIKESLSPDDGSSILDYALFDVILPGAKDLIYNVFTDSIDMIFYGDKRTANNRRSSRSSQNRSSRVSYSSYYDDEDNGIIRRGGTRRANMDNRGFSFDNVAFDNRGDAMEVLECLRDALDPVNGYGMVSVANFYEAAGVKDGWSYIYNDWGWYDLNSAYVDKIANGAFVIKFPKPTNLK